MTAICTSGHVLAEVKGRMGFITLNRARALNALSLPMLRDLTQALKAWQNDANVLAVAIRGIGRGAEGQDQPFGAFCAGGDIRFFHAAVLSGNPDLDAFFTEEYALNHLIHTYSKPYIAFMDGIVMGGGMGISQGASLRIVTERTRMAMPETGIGLFPDVGGGYFLSRCPGHVGEYLALTGQAIGAVDAIANGLADGSIPSGQLASLWDTLGATPFESANAIEHYVATKFIANYQDATLATRQINHIFALPTVLAMLEQLESAPDAWSAATAALLRSRSPLLLHVVLEQLRRARSMGLADNLRMERGMVYQCFHLRPGAASETMEGIRALAIDKDHAPRWNPPKVEDVTAAMVQAFFASPWAEQGHPLRGLG